MEIKILSATPHSEEDVISKNPIRWEIGGLPLQFPIFSYKDYTVFDKGIRHLSAQNLLGKVYSNQQEIEQALSDLYGNYPDLKLFDDLLLPRFIIRFTRIVDKEKTTDILNKWIADNPEKTQFPALQQDSSDINIKNVLTEYMINNCYHTDCYILFMALLNLQTDLKKKAIQKVTEEKEKTNARSPQSQATVIALESIQRKRLARLRTSSS